jgi:histidyl-tRNA synthetase
MKMVQSIRGMNDLLPEDASLFMALEGFFVEHFATYQFEPIILPILEKTELFCRGIGNATDIIEKEMYTFQDRNEESLSLRPEGTAGAVRAALEHGLIHNQIRKFWYVGPMFRHERPQKGRYRQFYQVGLEIFGIARPDVEAEMLLMLLNLWKKLGIETALSLEINTIGQLEERKAYRQALLDFLTPRQAELDTDSQRRLETNPLRILDSKAPETQALLENAPRLNDFLSQTSLAHFEALTTYLTALGVSFEVNPNLVRGLDYYSHTVFEWTTPHLGAQSTVCGGGRYDSLITELGGRATPAFGAALGLERLMLLIKDCGKFVPTRKTPVAYLIINPELETLGLKTAQSLREQGLIIALNSGGGSFKSQLNRAQNSGASLAVTLGETNVEVLFLSEHQPKITLPLTELSAFLTQQTGK